MNITIWSWPINYLNYYILTSLRCILMWIFHHWSYDSFFHHSGQFIFFLFYKIFQHNFSFRKNPHNYLKFQKKKREKKRRKLRKILVIYTLIYYRWPTFFENVFLIFIFYFWYFKWLKKQTSPIAKNKK